MVRTESASNLPDVQLQNLFQQCRLFIETRFPSEAEVGAAAVLVDDGVILLGTSPDFPNPATQLCHEAEPILAAYRLDKLIKASVCLFRSYTGEFVVMSPCGVCCERLAAFGPNVQVAVPDTDKADVDWVQLREVIPYYWRTVFDDGAGWGRR